MMCRSLHTESIQLPALIFIFARKGNICIKNILSPVCNCFPVAGRGSDSSCGVQGLSWLKCQSPASTGPSRVKVMSEYQQRQIVSEREIRRSDTLARKAERGNSCKSPSLEYIETHSQVEI